MALQSRINKAIEVYLATQSKAAAVGGFLYPSSYTFPGKGMFTSIAPRNFPYWNTDPMQSSAVMNVLAWIQRNFGQAHLELEQEVMVKGKKQEKKIEQHPYLELLWNPNPHYNYHSFWGAVLLSYFLDGNAYVIKVRNARGFGVPTELWYEPHWCLKPHWPSDGSMFIDYYERRVNGVIQKIPPENVIHFRFNLNPANPRYGLSPLKAALLQVFTDEEVSAWVAALCKNMAIPGVVVSPEQTIGMTPEKAAAMKQTWKRKFAGDNRGEPLILDFKGTVTTLGYNPSDMDFTAISNKAETRIAGALGVPAIVAGFSAGLESSTYNNLANLKRSAFEECLEPCWEVFEDTLDRQLLPDFDSSGKLETCFETCHIRALQENETERQDRERKNFEAGVMTLNEYRECINLDPLPEGDVFYVPNKSKPLTAQILGEMASEKPQPPPAPNDPNADPNATPNPPAKSLKKKSLIEWEGLQLSREPTDLEKTLIKSLDAAMSVGKQSLEGALLTVREELIGKAVKELATMEPADYHSLVLDVSPEMKARVQELLAQSYRKGRELVREELATQKRIAGKAADGEDFFAKMASLAKLTVSRIINEVQTRASEIAAKIALLLGTGEEASTRLKSELEDTSTGYVGKAAAGATNAAISEGRASEWAYNKDEIARVIYSCVLDANSCGVCEAADGAEAETEDGVPDVPNPDCEGGPLCRCIHVYVLKSEA